MLLIRVDANNTVGLGHLVRCINMADFFKSKKIRVIFISKSEYVSKWLHNKGFELIMVPRYALVKDELEIIRKIVYKKGKHAMLLDVNNFHTFYDLDSYDNYLKCLKALSLFLISFEDPYHCVHSADIIIIPYLASAKLKIPKKQNTKYLLGLKYFILGPEFLNIRPIRIKKKMNNIMISMGGCDPNNITLKVVDSLKESELKFNLSIVLGDLFQEIEYDIINILKNYPGSYKLVKNAKNLAQIMSESDLAIINSGLTKYEAISVGLPCIVISNNDYHSSLMKDFDEHNVFLHLGSLDKLDIRQIAESADSLAKDYLKRKRMAFNGKSLVDGLGVQRIFSEIPTELLYET